MMKLIAVAALLAVACSDQGNLAVRADACCDDNELDAQEQAVALPTSRNRTYSTGTPIDPTDMDDIQDQIIAARTGSSSGTFHAIDSPAIQGSLSFSTPVQGVPGWVSSGAGQKHRIRIALPTGYKIKSIDWHFDGADGSTKTLRLKRATTNNGLSDNTVTGWDTTSTASVVTELTQDGPDEVIGAFNGPEDVYYAEFTSGANGDEFFGVYVAYDRG